MIEIGVVAVVPAVGVVAADIVVPVIVPVYVFVNVIKYLVRFGVRRVVGLPGLDFPYDWFHLCYHCCCWMVLLKTQTCSVTIPFLAYCKNYDSSNGHSD